VERRPVSCVVVDIVRKKFVRKANPDALAHGSSTLPLPHGHDAVRRTDTMF
jgi:hypothetical protein